MNGTYLRIEALRVLRDPVTLFFTTALPTFFYVMFGANAEWGHYAIGDGNVSMYTMIGMAAYGAVTATSGAISYAAVERMQGWGRQLALTPMRDSQYIAVKVAVAVGLAALPVTIIYAIGALTNAAAPLSTWVISYVLVLVGAVVFALYGLVIGLAFRSEAASAAASGSIVVWGFLGNVFMPLDGWMLTVAHFTPLYGIVSLARYPLTGGLQPNTSTGALTTEPLWYAIANVGAWTALFVILTLVLLRRSRGRQ